MRKKGLIGLITLLFVFGLFANAVFAAVEYNYLKVSLLSVGDNTAFVNDEEVSLEAAPYIHAKAGKTLVPLRFMEKALNATIDWDKATRTATLKTKDKEVKVTIGQKTAYVNGTAVDLDVAAEIKNTRTFVPLRFISENLGAQVEYEKETKTITIKYVDKTGWKEFKESATGETFQYPADWKVLSEDKNGIKLETPNGTVIGLKSENRDSATILKEKKDTYNKDGWEVLAEEPVDPDNPALGNGITAVKGDLENLEDAKIYVGAVLNLDNMVFVMEFTGGVTSSDQDLLLFEDLLPE